MIETRVLFRCPSCGFCETVGPTFHSPGRTPDQDRPLTNAEEDTLTLLFRGMKPVRIAKQLGEKSQATKMRMHRIYRKLGVRDLGELIWRAHNEGGFHLWTYDPVRKQTRVNGHRRVKICD